MTIQNMRLWDYPFNLRRVPATKRQFIKLIATVQRRSCHDKIEMQI